MKQIDEWILDDNFNFEENVFFGVKIYSDGKHIFQDMNTMLYINAIGHVCEKCGKPTEDKGFRFCENCVADKKKEEYKNLEIVEESNMLYSDTLDEYFEKDSWDCIYEYLDENDDPTIIDFNFFRIHPCKQYFASTIDIDDYFEEAPEDFDIDSFAPIEEIQELVNKVNSLILSNSIGYTPDMTKRISMSDENWESIIDATIQERYDEAHRE